MNDPEGPGDPQPQGERDDKPELDIDSAFAAIIADFALPVPHGVGPWPASEDLDDDPSTDTPGDAAIDGATDGATDGAAWHHGDGAAPEPGAAGAAGPAAVAQPDHWDPPIRRISVPGTAPAAPEIGGAGRHADADRTDEDDDGYQPPEPPPLPRGDVISRVAWAAVIGGPLFLLVAAMLWRSLPTFLLLLALMAFVGGFVTLVARMPQEHPDDPDDGAVV